MVTLKQTLHKTRNWALDRISILTEEGQPNQWIKSDDASALHAEFQEWIEPDLESDVLSLEYIEDFDSGVDIIEI